MSTDEDFHAFAEGLDYPMFVVTAAAGDDRDGCLVGFTTQVSIDPARFLVCLSDKNRTFRIAEHASALAVHVLDGAQRPLAELFGSVTGDESDKLARCAWSQGPAGTVTLDDAPAWFVGDVVGRVPFGDHVGFVLEPVAASGGTGGRSLLTFAAAKQIDPGHEA